MRRTASAKLNSQNANMWGQISGAENSARTANGETRWQQREYFDSGRQSRTPLEQTTGNSPPKGRTETTTESSKLPLDRASTTHKQGPFQGRDVYVFGFDTPKVISFLQEINNANHYLLDRRSPTSSYRKSSESACASKVNG